MDNIHGNYIHDNYNLRSFSWLKRADQASLTPGFLPPLRHRRQRAAEVDRPEGVHPDSHVEPRFARADRVAFLENGRNRETADVAVLRADPEMVKRYVGVS